jgi:hypothetical protein
MISIYISSYFQILLCSAFFSAYLANYRIGPGTISCSVMSLRVLRPSFISSRFFIVHSNSLIIIDSTSNN